MTALVFLIVLAAVIGAAFLTGLRAGGNAAKKALTERELEAAKRISDARKTSPSNAHDVAERLRHGGHL